MEFDQTAWVVHRHLVDPCLDELDIRRGRGLDAYAGVPELGRSPIMPVDVPLGAARGLNRDLPRDLWELDTEALKSLARDTRTLLARTDGLTSAG